MKDYLGHSMPREKKNVSRYHDLFVRGNELLVRGNDFLELKKNLKMSIYVLTHFINFNQAVLCMYMHMSQVRTV